MNLSKLKTKPVTSLFILLFALVLLDFLVFRIGQSYDYLAAGVGYILIYFVARANKLTFSDIGLSPKVAWRGVRLGFLVSIPLVLVAFLSFYLNPETFSNPNYKFDTFGLLIYVLIWVPLRTVVFEELVFRGVVPSVLEKNFSSLHVYIISSLAFGFWHIIPALEFNGEFINKIILDSNAVVVLGSAIFTSIAGAFLYYLRKKSGSLLTPIVVHWAVNAVGVFLAASAGR